MASHKRIFSAAPRGAARAAWAAMAALTLAGVAGALFVAEWALDLRSESEHGLRFEAGRQRHIALREHRPGARRVVVGHDGRAFPLRVDQNGFIEPGRAHESPDASVVFLGGSTTECLYVEEAKRYPHLAGRLLEAATGVKVNSYNGGVSGNNSLHSLDALLNKVLPLRPDIVVLHHNANDLTAWLHLGGYHGGFYGGGPRAVIEERTPAGALASLAAEAKNATLPNLFERWRAFRRGLERAEPDEFADRRAAEPAGGVPRLEEFLAAYRANLELFVRATRLSGAAPVLMTQASNPGPAERAFEDSYWEAFRRANEAARAVGQELGAAVVDLDREFSRKPELFYDNIHYNDEGSERVARHLAEALAPLARARAAAPASGPPSAPGF